MAVFAENKKSPSCPPARSFIAEKVGVFTPKRLEKDLLNTGEVGYVVAGIKDIFGAPVGDTITWTDKPAAEQLTGFQQVQPRVFAGFVSGQFR